MSETFRTGLTIGVVAAATCLTRAIPYLLFGGKKGLPHWAGYLSDVLPAGIMVILVVYCLRNTSLRTSPHGLPELCAMAVVVGLQLWKRKTLLSILMGTACYMMLLRLL